jgi:hypothetical protein
MTTTRTKTARTNTTAGRDARLSGSDITSPVPEPSGRESGFAEAFDVASDGRRVRHDLAEGAAVMVFSLAASVTLASVLALVLGAL